LIFADAYMDKTRWKFVVRSSYFSSQIRLHICSSLKSEGSCWRKKLICSSLGVCGVLHQNWSFSFVIHVVLKVNIDY